MDNTGDKYLHPHYYCRQELNVLACPVAVLGSGAATLSSHTHGPPLALTSFASSMEKKDIRSFVLYVLI